MSEENKIVELKEEDLEKVSGGGLAEKTSVWECDICHMKFSDVDSLGRHEKEKHSGCGPNKSV